MTGEALRDHGTARVHLFQVENRQCRRPEQRPANGRSRLWPIQRYGELSIRPFQPEGALRHPLFYTIIHVDDEYERPELVTDAGAALYRYYQLGIPPSHRHYRRRKKFGFRRETKRLPHRTAGGVLFLTAVL